MEEGSESLKGEITGIRFALATHEEVRKSSINECPINHSSQLANPFLGLPLEIGKCESCGGDEPQKCEGHFGYTELPIPIYHPSHVVELRQMLSLLCLKCLKYKDIKLSAKNSGGLENLLTCCEETSHITVQGSKMANGASSIQLKLSGRSNVSNGTWRFLEKYGYRHGEGHKRTLLPSEVLGILKELPKETKKKLAKKGYFPQEGYILLYLPIPPNCLSMPDISDGISVISNDVASMMMKKVLKQIEIIKSTRSVERNFESHEVETNELQGAVSQYLQVRGAGAASNEMGKPYGVNKEASKTAPKAWLEKMRTLFISKGSSSSSRSVITGETYSRVDEIGLPSEIAQKITFEEKVNVHNIKYLQSLVDKNLCLSYIDGVSTYSLREGSKGHTFLRPGQVVNRRIMDGDIVFINRPPTTHKHSLQALRVYVHEDHTVKINPLMCGPLGADFDGDCVHLFYPQSLAARAEALELFSVEKQLLSSHTGVLNLQLPADALSSIKLMFKTYFYSKSSAQQLSMFARHPLPPPALYMGHVSAPCWTALQVLQTALPAEFHCYGDRYMIQKSEILKIDFNRNVIQSMLNEIITCMICEKGPEEALHFFDSLLPLLMENLFSEGHSVSLEDFIIPSPLLGDLQVQIQDVSPLLFQLRTSYNELVERQMESNLRRFKMPAVTFSLTSSALGNLIDSKSESAMNKIVQQIGFLGMQLHDRGKFYSRNLVDDIAQLFHQRYPFRSEFPCEEFGLVINSFIHGLDPYEEIVHSVATREVIIRSSRGLAEPGTLFKNLMAILRDVMICYDGTVRNISSKSIIQFDYGVQGERSQSLFPPGEPVGVLAATAMSNPAYKAVLDSSSSSNSSWDMMKEILFCNVNFKNNITDRRVILYLNNCECGRKFCRENASCAVKDLFKKVSLRDAAAEFFIEYKSPLVTSDSHELDARLVGHIHLNKALLNNSNINMHDIIDKCQDEVNSFRKKKNFSLLFKRIHLCVSECCSFSDGSKWSGMPCLKFSWIDMGESSDIYMEKTCRVMADVICPALLDTVVKGDPRIAMVNIIWINPDTSTSIGISSDSKIGELAVEVVVERKAVKKSGDAWRIVLDCCLPVFHLIDTSRSIPYSVKQIQEVLGISCAFDQAVKRLSTSVKMVTKGVLQDHIILLGSSMTSTGNLIGFNISGIKAMNRALGDKVPFTEATLYTPRKCFERAAEKCRLDSVSSIVASCCWGKHVEVGTGTRFDILWNEEEAPLEKDVIQVYDFLRLVRKPGCEAEDDLGCLGDDVDKFEMEDEHMEDCPSPKDCKYVFEDAELEMRPSDGWEITTGNSGVKKQANDLAWNSQSQEPSLIGWNSTRSKPETLPAPMSSEGAFGWSSQSQEQKMKAKNTGTWGRTKELPPSAGSQGWGSADEGNESTPVHIAHQGPSGWNPESKSHDQSGWDAKTFARSRVEEDNSLSLPDQWQETSPGWGPSKTAHGSNWETQSPNRQAGGSARKKGSNISQGSSDAGHWRNKHSASKSHDQSGWNSKTVAGSGSHVEKDNSWSLSAQEQATSPAWGALQTAPGSETETHTPWRQRGGPAWKKKSSHIIRCSSDASDWRNKPNQPPRTPRPWKPPQMDLTPEEKYILSEIEPILKSIRRIMHQEGYTDGYPIPKEDQSYIMHNVLAYHPDKASKLGGGIDHIMVSKHSSFQDTRCLYVVSPDNQKQDFSYKKCLENLVKEKYPEHAESFISKYWRRPQSGGRDKNSQCTWDA